MLATALFGVLVVLPASIPQELGPTGLPKGAAKACVRVEKRWSEARKRAQAWIDAHRTERPDSIATFAILTSHWIPGSAPQEGELDRNHLGDEEHAVLREIAAIAAENAQALLKVELGGAAGFAAHVSLGIDPRQDTAARILGYVASDEGWVHPRLAELRRDGMIPGPRGWTRGGAAGSAEGATSAFSTRLEFAFFTIESDVQADAFPPELTTIDAVVLWMRSRFKCVAKYTEPAWPISVRVYADRESCESHGDSVPAGGFAHWLPREKRIVALFDAFVPGRTMRLDRVVQHELAHGFLDLAFPHVPDPKAGIDNASSGWLVEGFPSWVYGVQMDSPNDPRFWETFQWRGEAATRLMRGENVLGELTNSSYAESRRNPLAQPTAAFLVDFCAADPIRWEGFARLQARFSSYTEIPGSFQVFLGQPKAASKALGRWIQERTKANK